MSLPNPPQRCGTCRPRYLTIADPSLSSTTTTYNYHLILPIELVFISPLAMRVTFAPILALASIPLLATAAIPSNHTIQHRFLPHPRPSTIDSSWSELGTIQLDFGGAGLEASLEKRLSRDAQVDDGKGWYQVGLADVHGKVSHVSSVRSVSLCSVRFLDDQYSR